jgi:hypothetical protein
MAVNWNLLSMRFDENDDYEIILRIIKLVDD